MVQTLLPLGCVLAGFLTLSACSSSSDEDAAAGVGAAGAAGAEGGSAGEAGAGGSGESGRGGEANLAEVAQWPMPNAPHAGLPNTEKYDTSTPGVVHDLVTGLDWLQNPGSTLYSRADAVSYCDALSLAGKDDWRVPTFIELVSLFDAVPNDADPPLYLASVFEARDRYWCSTPPVTTSTELGRMLAFTADTCGAKSCSIGVSGEKGDAIAGAFCVRGSAAAATSERFDIESDRVSDTLTGLAWITLPSAIQTGTHAEAVSRCSALGDGARLPSVNELLTIFVPLLDMGAFPDWPNSLFGWSSSAAPAKPGSFWAAASGGATEAAAASAINRIECVR